MMNLNGTQVAWLAVNGWLFENDCLIYATHRAEYTITVDGAGYATVSKWVFKTGKRTRHDRQSLRLAMEFVMKESKKAVMDCGWFEVTDHLKDF